jgi:uncharacterized membrane protein
MSDRRLRRAMVVIGCLGVALAGYLTWVHYAGLKPLCLASGGCERVQSSPYSELAGIPVALIGLVGYAAIVATLFWPGEGSRSVACGLALIGFGFSLYLTYLELFTIKAVCQWCLASALLMTSLAVCASIRLWIGESGEPSQQTATETDGRRRTLVER